MDNSIKDKVVGFLRQVGLDGEQALVYLYLQKNGPSTVLEISRGLLTGRTKLYPALEDMVKKQVVTVHERHYGTTYGALPPENLEFLVLERERESSTLRLDLSATVHALNSIRLTAPNSSNIIEYHGENGLKQMTWNQTKANDHIKIFSQTGSDAYISPHFADKLREEWTLKQIKCFELTNDKNKKLMTKIQGYPALYKTRYIDPQVLNIEYETAIYDNVTALLHFSGNEIIGVEIYNDKLARQQEQLFDLIWSLK